MKRIDCLDDTLLQMFIADELDATEHAIVKEHVATCGSCQLAIGAYKQLMWDLEHPEEVTIPAGQEAVQQFLMDAWANRDIASPETKSSSRSLLPAWAGNSLRWTRRMPGVHQFGTLLSRTGSRIITARLPFGKWWRRKGGDRR